MSEPRCWVIVVSKNHIQRGIEGGFVQANHGKAAPLKRMKVGDWVLIYSPKVAYEGTEKLQAFTAIGRVTGEAVYPFDMGDGFVPFRRDVTFLDSAETPIVSLVSDLTFIRNKQQWGYLFRFGFFEIPMADLRTIAGRMIPAERIAA